MIFKEKKIIYFISAVFLLGGFFLLFPKYLRPPDGIVRESRGRGFPLSADLSADKGKEKKTSFLFFGDLMLDRHVKEKISKDGFNFLFSSLAENNVFNGFDFIAANLEGAVTDRGAHYQPEMAYDFAFAPEDVAALKEYGFNFFNLANNHLSDQGARGEEETRKNLDLLDLAYSGCADAALDACSSRIVESGGLKFALVGFSMVYHNFNLEEAKKIIAEQAGKSDAVIVNIHWGSEYDRDFNPRQAEIGRALVDAGADLIIGHHPHVVQGLEIYKNRVIFYSLGNFIFDQYFSRATQEGLAVAVVFAEKEMRFRLIPFASRLSRPELLSSTEEEKFLKDFFTRSRGLDGILLEKEFFLTGWREKTNKELDY